MCVNLYTSRVLLQQLGITDYGVYNVVGGVVSLFSFINGAMISSTQRYITYQLGRNDISALNGVLTTSRYIHILIAFLSFVLCESVGVWFVNNQLSIPKDRLIAANWVFQFSVLTLLLNIIPVPYNALLIAYERMNVFAIISVVRSFLLLVVVFLIQIVPIDKLVSYSFLVCLLAFFIYIVYVVYCKRVFAVCIFPRFKKKTLFNEMIRFAAWNFVGSIAWLLKGQGINVILNLFFGPALNAANSVAQTVSSATGELVRGFTTAMNPQITKYYAMNQIQNMELLCYRGIKCSFVLQSIVAVPVLLNIDYILSTWLETVPEYSSVFVCWILYESLCSALLGSSQFITSMLATGHIRNYQIVVGGIILLNVPVSYVFLRLGCDAVIVFVVAVCLTIVSCAVRFYYCIVQIGFNLTNYLVSVLKPVTIMLISYVPLLLYIKKTIIKSHLTESDPLLSFILLVAISVFFISFSSWYFCFNRHEKEVIVSFVKSKMKRENEFD